MLVDDEKDILDVVRKKLEMSGFDVVGFTDPLQAAQHFENGGDSFNIMISDIRMPKMTGFQLARKVKELHPNIKIVLMSSFEVGREEFDKVLPSTHVDSFLCKPFPLTKLIEAIEALD